jgi:hypothetical protein
MKEAGSQARQVLNLIAPVSLPQFHKFRDVEIAILDCGIGLGLEGKRSVPDCDVMAPVASPCEPRGQSASVAGLF